MTDDGPPPTDAEDAPSGYDALAELAAEGLDPAGSPWGDSHYQRHHAWPAARDLLPDLDGARVLVAGCGRGDHVGALRDRGASVVGVDASGRALAAARSRFGDDPAVTLRRTDLTEPLDFADADGFDLVFSHLVLGHVEAWTPVLEESARVLAPGGRLQFTTVHPQYLARHDEVRNYYDRRRIVVEWPGGAEIPVYYRSTADALNPVADAGFRIERVREPEPCEAYAEHAPERHEAARRRPEVLCVRAELVG